MTDLKNSTEEKEEEVVKRIHTKLKFERSQETGCLIAYVSKHPLTKLYRGINVDEDFPKKICVVDKVLSFDIMTHVLYDCVLIPMTEKQGFVVIEAEPTKFKATVETIYVKHCVYVVQVKFGNKKIRFDPLNGIKESVKSLPECRAVLAKRIDVKNLQKVLDDFDAAANNILYLMKRDDSLNHKKEKLDKKVEKDEKQDRNRRKAAKRRYSDRRSPFYKKKGHRVPRGKSGDKRKVVLQRSRKSNG